MAIRKCLECKEPVSGRVDKKFCSDICRNSFHNKANSISSDYIRNVNTMLKKNRKILEDLVPQSSAQISKSKLLQRGFNFHYYTNIQRRLEGGHYFFCYDYGYLPLENDNYLVVKQEENEQ
jgi:hypothetical protein